MKNTTPKSLKGTRTEVNLANAFIAESTAHSRYTFFSQTAKKECFFQVANVFAETAANELRHAKVFLKYLAEGCVTSAPVNIDAGILTPTVDNLGVAAEEERVDGVEQYLCSAKVADEEGFVEIAEHFRAIAEIESHHRDCFLKLQKRIQDGTMWHRDKPVKWQCLVCGYIYEGVKPPDKCPACDHPYQHFMTEEDNL